MRAPAFWNLPRRTLAARLLRPLGAVQGAATAWRMARPGAETDVPAICVGNFVAGGAGKTPVALAIAQILRESGEKVFMLSRGYGGERRASPLWVEPRLHDARQVGDEPLLLAAHLPAIVGPDRSDSARLAVLLGATVLVLDDGLQNPSLAKTLSIAAVDGAVGHGNGLCLPAGPLRAAVAAQSRHVQALVVIGAGTAGDEAARQAERAGMPVLRASLAPDAAVAAQLRGRTLVAFAGIGRPGKFFDTLEALGATLAARHGFADHHVFSPAELAALAGEASARGALLVTTQKDLARIPPDRRPAGLLALPVSIAFDQPDRLRRLLDEALAAFRARR